VHQEEAIAQGAIVDLVDLSNAACSIGEVLEMCANLEKVVIGTDAECALLVSQQAPCRVELKTNPQCSPSNTDKFVVNALRRYHVVTLVTPVTHCDNIPFFINVIMH
jgi:hypothetical protein